MTFVVVPGRATLAMPMFIVALFELAQESPLC